MKDMNGYDIFVKKLPVLDMKTSRGRVSLLVHFDMPFVILRVRSKLSSVQNLGWLFEIGDYATQLDGDYIISQYKDANKQTNQYNGMSAKGFVAVAQFMSGFANRNPSPLNPRRG